MFGKPVAGSDWAWAVAASINMLAKAIIEGKAFVTRGMAMFSKGQYNKGASPAYKGF
jgi:hypothetical protein